MTTTADTIRPTMDRASATVVGVILPFATC